MNPVAIATDLMLSKTFPKDQRPTLPGKILGCSFPFLTIMFVCFLKNIQIII
jgi:hypothetical protein